MLGFYPGGVLSKGVVHDSWRSRQTCIRDDQYYLLVYGNVGDLDLIN